MSQLRQIRNRSAYIIFRLIWVYVLLDISVTFIQSLLKRIYSTRMQKP